MKMDLQNLEQYAIIGIVGGYASKILGGFDYTLKAMVMLMLIDIIIGFLCASFFDISKYSNNGVSSDALMKGAIRKITILAIVSIGVIADRLLNTDYIRNAVVVYFIATEAISILEHLINMGIPVPSALYSIMENMQKENKLNNGETKTRYEGKRLKK